MQKFFSLLCAVLLLAGCDGLIVVPNDKTISKEEVEETEEVEEVEVEAKGPIKIGFIGPLSGEAVSIGITVQNVVRMYVAEKNSQGGIKGRQIEVDWQDGKCKGAEANLVANYLLNQAKVSLIVGGACSGETLAAAELTEAKKAILFSTASTNPRIKEAGNFVFRSVPSGSSQGKVLARYAKGQGYKAVGVLYEQTDYASGIFKAFEAEAKRIGLTVVDPEKFAINESNFSNRITKLKNNTEIEALLIAVESLPKFEIIAQKITELKFKKPLLLNDVIIGGESEKIKLYDTLFAGESAKAVGADFRAPEGRKMTDFLAKYKEAYGRDPEYLNYAASTADGMGILLTALEQVPDVANTTKVRDTLSKIEYEGLLGQLSFDQDGEIVGVEYSMFEYGDLATGFSVK